MRGFAYFAVLSAAAFSSLSHAIVIEQSELNAMQSYAIKHDTVPVVVHLLSLGINEIKAANSSKLKKIESDFLNEIGDGVVSAGRESNGLGQLSVHLTPKGVQLLSRSKIAISAWQGPDWILRSKLNNGDGTLDLIDAEFAKSKLLQVELFPNVDGMAYSIATNGQVEILRSDAVDVALAETKASAKNASPSARLLADATYGAVRIEVSREDLISIVAQKKIRHIRLATQPVVPSTTYDTDLEKIANKSGKVRAIFSIRNPMNSGDLSAESSRRTQEAHQDVVTSVLSKWRLDKSNVQIWPNVGAFSINLTVAELSKIKLDPDSRISRVDANKPLLDLTLATSTPMLNLQNTWNAGYSGAGQTIYIVDSGVQKSHPFLKNSSGNTRVIDEACFGTNDISNGYHSPCPGQPVGGNGDSPPNTVDAGDLIPAINCPSPEQCEHGLHVAGIAAGRTAAGTPSGVQGVAHGANIGSLRVSSYPSAGGTALKGYTDDIIAAMEYLVAKSVPYAGGIAPYTVNISQSAGVYLFPCSGIYSAFNNAVTTLTARGIPVVVGAGNDSAKDGIGWPSCSPGAIAVGAVNNSGSGNTTWANSNRNHPDWNPGKTYLMAPGNAVVSSISSGGYGSKFGTSMAAPHVAGLYALLKSFAPTASVDSLSALLKGYALSYVDQVCDNSTPGLENCVPRRFYRVRMPNLN